METYSLYALQLTENKWFITLSNKPLDTTRVASLQDDYEIVYDFIREAPIVSVEKLEHNVTDGCVINNYVKQFMKTYGINNVRGGCYTDSALPETTVAVLEREINYGIDIAIDDMNILYAVKEEYVGSAALEEEIRQILLKVAQIKEQIRKFIKHETVKLENDYIQYAKSKDRLALYKQITPSTIEDIMWLLDSVADKETVRYNKARYASLVYEQLPRITEIFASIVEDPDEYRIDDIKYKPIEYLYNPNLVLDKTFLLRSSLRDEDAATKLLQYFEYMAYVILNRTMELEFDVGSYGANYEKKYGISKALVSRMAT